MTDAKSECLRVEIMAPDEVELTQGALSPADLAEALVKLRSRMLSFARLQLRNSAWAEDAVSETILAVLSKPQAFDGRSQFKTYVYGVLKHKLLDQFRRYKREVTHFSLEDTFDVAEELFEGDGHWLTPPADWGDPEEHLVQIQFFEVLEACVDGLPVGQGRLFMMREWLELDAAVIQKILKISASNYWVMMHRAKLRLRECLQLKWFSRQKECSSSS